MASGMRKLSTTTFKLNKANACFAGGKHEICSNSQRPMERGEAGNIYKGIISTVNPIRHVLLLHNIRVRKYKEIESQRRIQTGSELVNVVTFR